MLTFEATPRVPTSAILNAIREAQKHSVGDLTQRHYRQLRRPGWPSLKVIYARFGSWGAAMKAAGLR